MAEKKQEPQKSKKKKSFWDFSDWTRETWIYVALFCVIIVFILYLGYKWLTDDEYLFRIIIEWFVIPVNDLGAWGWVLYLVFMLFQSIAVPIPSELVLLSAGLLWGTLWGFILGMIGSFISGSMAYFIGRKGGRPLVEKFIGADSVEVMDKYIQKYGAPIVFVTRAVPFIAFDPTSYVSGMLKVDYKKYIIATMLGAIPRCLFYAFLGNSLRGDYDLNELGHNPELVDKLVSEGSGRFNIIVIVILVLLGGMFLLYNYVIMPYLRRKAKHIELPPQAEKTAAVQQEQELPKKTTQASPKT